MCMHAHIAVRCALLYFIFAPEKKGVGTFGALWLSAEREAHDDHAQVCDAGEEDRQEDGLRRAARRP